MGCGASIDAGVVERKTLAPSLVVTLHDPKPGSASQNDETLRSSQKDGPRHSTRRGNSRFSSTRDASKDGERFNKSEVTVVLLLGAANFTMEHFKEWAHIGDELGFCRMGMERLHEQTKTEIEAGNAEAPKVAGTSDLKNGAENEEAANGEGISGVITGAGNSEVESRLLQNAVKNGVRDTKLEVGAERTDLGNEAKKPEEESEAEKLNVESGIQKEEADLGAAAETERGSGENGGAQIARGEPQSPRGRSGSFNDAFRGLLGAIRRMAGRRLLIDGSTWTVRDVEAFEAIVAPIDLVLLFDCAQNASITTKTELSEVDVSSPPDCKAEDLSSAARNKPGDRRASSGGDVSGDAGNASPSAKADVIGQSEKCTVNPEADVSSQPQTGVGPARPDLTDEQKLGCKTADVSGQLEASSATSAAAAADRFGPLRQYFAERVIQGNSDVIVHVVSSGSASADDVAAVLREQEHRFVRLESVARVDTSKRLAEEDKRWAALMAANPSGPIAAAPPEEAESAAEKFRKEYPWVVPLKYVASFCVRLTERYWAWFDPEPVEDQSDSEEEGGK